MNHYFENIQGWFNFQAAYKSAVERAQSGAVFVEVGSWKGRSAAYMAVEIINSKKDIQLVCVDHWLGSNELLHKNDEAAERLFDLFKENLQPAVDAGLALKIVQSDSAVAADQFESESVDFIWIDAGHEYEEVIADITAWLPKLKTGCIIGGDDWQWPGVQQAVRETLPGYWLEGDYPYWLYKK